jgi:hypothetical protein
MRESIFGFIVALAAIAAAMPVGAQAQRSEDSEAGPPLQEGEIISFENVDRLRPYLPKQFWDNRDMFFYEGMELEIGPTQFNYSPSAEFDAATERFRDGPRIGPDGSLENFIAGRPFPDASDCKGDPQAGVKIMWNFTSLGGDGSAHFFYSYWDRGEQLPLYYEGSGRTAQLANRFEAQYLDVEKSPGDVFRGEKRKNANSIDVDAPFDARGIKLLSYRYKASDGSLDQTKYDDTWVYVPTLRRVRRITTAQRTDAISGTDFTMDDLRSFAGIVPQYEWTCLEERRLISPTNTKVKGYPYEEEQNFGPYGLSFASDRWELRDAILVRMTPKNADHPYHHKDIWIDKQTFAPLYSFAYDQKNELWKIITHNKRWSEDTTLTGVWFPGWEGVPNPRALVVVSDIITNVQTGTGNRIEFWDAHAEPFKSKGKLRRFIDVGRLTKGR